MGARGRALSALTFRGRCLVGGGLVLALTGAVLGERSLVQLAVFVLALPLLGALTVARSRFRMSTRRTVTPQRVPRGEPAEVLLQLENADTRRGGLWLLTEQVPAALGRPHRFSVAGLAPGATRTVRYRVTGRSRGRYELGPLRLRVVDPFGLVDRTVAGSDTAPLAVVPRVRPLGGGGPGGAHGRGGDGSHRAIAVHGDDDVSVREYRRGDDLRKVHWRATARTGELMVRLEERPWRAQATLLLDTRARAHLVTPARGVPRAVPGPPGDDCPPGDSLEWLVEAAASIGVALAERGAAVRVVTEAGELSPASGLGAEELLDRLAAVGPSRRVDLSAAVASACRAAGNGPLVCLLGAVGPEDVAELVHLRPATGTDTAILLDITGWADAGPGRGRRTGPGAARDALTAQREQAVALLAGAGWRVTTAAAGQDIGEVWAGVAGVPQGAPS
ncbi:DUF58 domain-containing protein [Blastococcus saxobsidens]|uniref:DUF58 domain-containing protein n=1 Tax=Blastococcus saxobsidens (strain DD2) TaxID=1146883 RepID=H6RTQ5_BLASD|nr:DUF58 domain-containing protein [Blastococcus saxobsidens]CCG03115.1 conserved protein of unknown function [Blastococcus saxobsidens DD2]